jgi:histidinol phosphatase-like PHP family hydrolase
VFSGIEISLAEDFLVIGVHDRELELAHWTYPELHRFVHENGGYIILAHPFRFHPKIFEDISQYPPDGIEIFSANTPISWQTLIRQIALQNKITLFSNSDAHQKEYIGKFYNEIHGSPKIDWELVQILRKETVTMFSNELSS